MFPLGCNLTTAVGRTGGGDLPVGQNLSNSNEFRSSSI